MTERADEELHSAESLDSANGDGDDELQKLSALTASNPENQSASQHRIDSSESLELSQAESLKTVAALEQLIGEKGLEALKDEGIEVIDRLGKVNPVIGSQSFLAKLQLENDEVLCVVKIYQPLTSEADDECYSRAYLAFQRERSVLTRSGSVFDSAEDEGHLQRLIKTVKLTENGEIPPFCNVLEFKRGEPWSSELEMPEFTKLEEEAAWNILEDITTGLLTLHDKGFAHRDVRTSNIILDDEGRASLIDPNIATEIVHTSYTVIRQGEWYLPLPGLLKGDELLKADLYALGANLVGALVGTPPLHLQSTSGNDRGLIDLSCLASRKDLSPQIVGVLKSLCSTESSERPSDARQALAVIKQQRESATSRLNETTVDNVSDDVLLKLITSRLQDIVKEDESDIFDAKARGREIFRELQLLAKGKFGQALSDWCRANKEIINLVEPIEFGRSKKLLEDFGRITVISLHWDLNGPIAIAQDIKASVSEESYEKKRFLNGETHLWLGDFSRGLGPCLCAYRFRRFFSKYLGLRHACEKFASEADLDPQTIKAQVLKQARRIIS